MTKDEYRSTTDDIIYLSGCVVNDTVPDKDRVAEINLENLYQVANKHFLTAIVGFALESAGIYDKRFIQAKAKSIRKVTAMEIDKELLFERLEQEKIWYMPLKGMIIKELYPSVGLRQMSDFDILFDEKYAEKVSEIMLELGFTCEHIGKGNHDVYFKQPVSNFEMHTGLFGENHKPEIFHYYIDVKKKLIKDKDNKYGYHFSVNDMYIYLTAHEYKHYNGGGTGLRSVLDTYVILKKYGNELDTDYIKSETEKLGIGEFEGQLKSLAVHLFGGIELTEIEQEMFEYITFSGTYGNIKNSVSNAVKKYGNGKKGKFRYIMKKLFIPMKDIKMYYPFYYKHKVLLPVLFFYRIGKAITVKRRQTKKTLGILKKIK